MASRRDFLVGGRNEGLSLVQAQSRVPPAQRSQVQANSSGSDIVAASPHGVDACLHTAFERFQEFGLSSNYSPYYNSTPSSLTESQISAYLYKLQRGGHIQPFGCLICVNESDFSVIAFSVNAPEMLGFTSGNEISGNMMGVDMRSLFAPEESLRLANTIRSHQSQVSNPLCVYSRVSKRPFYAILHRIDVGYVIDFEPLETETPSLFIAGVLQSQKLAMYAMTRLQSLPHGNIQLLCDKVVSCMREFTGYDRVMVYKFHDDEHGEVVAESKIPDLDSYVGLHYPATDIPQAARFLFQKNKSRMIVDCHATFVPVIQDESLDKPLCLGGSTLRAPHGCHAQYMANMGSIGTLVMAVIVHANDKVTGSHQKHEEKLWGLVACHHKSARSLPFPRRQACEYIVQAFGFQLNGELQLLSRLREKHVLRTQTLFCGMLVRDSLAAIVTQNPSIMDLVKCDGAALYIGGRCYSLGVTPTEAHIKHIVEWLFSSHRKSAGLTTDSLVWAKYPEATSLGDEVCGMAVARITSKDYVFWFRSNRIKEIKWGGEKSNPDHKDNDKRMHPRSSFEVFLEVIKTRSLPWEDAEIDAIHSLQLILKELLKDVANNNPNDNMQARVGDEELKGKKKLDPVAAEMGRIIETANAPIFSVNAEGCINGWNAKIAELTGLPVDRAIGLSLFNQIVHEESKETAVKLVSQSLKGEEEKNVEIKMRKFGSSEDKMPVHVVVNTCCTKGDSDNIFGVCFVGQDVTPQKVLLGEFIKLEGDYQAIMHSPNPLIPAIFGSDLSTCCSEWNKAMENMTGWSRDIVIGKMLVGEVFGNFCKLKDEDAMTNLMIMILNAIEGQNTDTIPFAFFDRNGEIVQALISAHTRVNMNGEIIGTFCFLQIPSPDMKQALELEKQQDLELERKQALELESMQKLSYICEELKNPLSGICTTNSDLEGSGLTEEQKRYLQIRTACVKQITQIITDVDQDILDKGLFKFDKTDFLLGNVINVVISQVTLLLKGRDVQLIHNIPEEIRRLIVYGDEARVQQVLTTFLSSMVNHVPEGWVDFQLQPIMQQISGDTTNLPFEFRIGCCGEGLPQELIQEMFHMSGWVTPEGLGLSTCRKILSQMNGRVEYTKESNVCYFTITLDLPMSKNWEHQC
ncbi:hypothetical protein DCAR_0935396 [Daucus carota subsp. sativus]|uniref:Phytochrome n=1 Tax=Daucus carota subsp. sativus TaxID=79200 RepID=A0A175YJ70_DAUCS|nr:PREDICTED: phytochrome B [Daucus carota subsp. sativus]WOH15850.1 hypothetical protein DCAR_0935396 [Daucus carota subsp. sativus]